MEKRKNDFQNSISVDDKSCAVFLKALSDFLAKNRTDMEGEADWKQITRLSRIHNVEGIIYHQCKNQMPPDIRAYFDQVFYSTLFLYKNRERMTSEIKKEFRNHNTPFFEVKGMEVSRYYPFPALRTMSDSDVVVRQEDKERAIGILLEMGFAYDHEYSGKEMVYSRSGLNVELHHSLIYDEVINVPEQELFFSECWNFVSDGKLNNSFHFLFLISHLRKHMLNAGAGVRQFMDIAAVARNDSALDWKWIAEKLSETKLLHFAQTCFGLIDYWFGIKIPVDYAPIDQSFAERATRKIMANGVFGINDKSNRSNAITNQMREFRGPRWAFRILNIIERLFPSYRFLRVSEEYKFLDRRPWLLPAAWCWRFYLMLSGKKTDVGELVGQIMTPNRIIDEREEELKRWGLVE